MFAALKGWCLLWIHDCLVFYNPHWFIAPYVMMCLFAPFMNFGVRRLPKHVLKTFIVLTTVLMLYQQLASSLFNDSFIFIFLYIIVCYIKRYRIYFKRECMAIVFGLQIVLILATAFNDYPAKPGILVFVNNYTSRLLANYTGASLIIASAAILFVVSVSENYNFNNKALNLIAGGTFGVYLFHETYFWPVEGGKSLSVTN